jgi:hypothetical protein
MKTAYATIRGFEIMRMFKKDSSTSGCMETVPRSHLLMNNSESTAEICPGDGFCAGFRFCNGAEIRGV